MSRPVEGDHGDPLVVQRVVRRHRDRRGQVGAAEVGVDAGRDRGVVRRDQVPPARPRRCPRARPARRAVSAAWMPGRTFGVPAQVVGLPAEHDRRLRRPRTGRPRRRRRSSRRPGRAAPSAPAPWRRSTARPRRSSAGRRGRRRSRTAAARWSAAAAPPSWRGAATAGRASRRRSAGRCRRPGSPAPTLRPRWMPSPVEVRAATVTSGDTVPLGEQLRVGAVPAGRQHDRARRDLELGAVAVDLDTGHPRRRRR